VAEATIDHVKKSFARTEVLKGVSVSVRDGGMMVILGPSGCGKSTLLRLIAGLDTVTSGTIAIGGRVVNDLEPKDRNIAMVFQNYALYPHMSVLDNMAYGLRNLGTAKAEVDRRVLRPEPGWYRELYGRIGRDWLWSSRLAMPDGELAAILEDPAVEAWVPARDGRDEGLLELDRRAPAKVELAFFGLTPALVGGGAGRWLMDRAIELAWQPGVRRFWVHTCSLDHPGALGFYVRSGFTPYAQAVEVADDPRLTGVLPRDAAPAVPLIE